jgi:hypothetical protein
MLKSLITAALACLIAWGASAQSPQHPQTQNKNGALSTNKTQPQPSPTINFPTLQQIANAIANGIERAREEYDAKHPAPPPDNSGWWFNFWLAAFTGGLVVVGAAQCFLIFGTLKATQKAADAAKDAAVALPWLERAYIFIENITSKDFDASLTLGGTTKGRFAIDYSFKNHGRTPAILRDIRIYALCLTSGLPSVEILELEIYRVPSVIGANQSSLRHTYIVQIEGWQYERLKDGADKIFFYGVLGYVDVFRNRQELGFCAEWDFGVGDFLFVQNEKLNYHT